MNISLKIIIVVVSMFALNGIANAASVTVATGGGAIASNTTAGCSAAGTWTALTGPTISEANAGEIGLGDIVLTAPAGFEFDTAAAVTIYLTGNGTNTRNINNIPRNTSVNATSVTATAITFTVTSISTRTNTLTWQGIQVRPTASSPQATGNISQTGTSNITGLTAASNFGTLTEVASSPACNVSAPIVTTDPASGLTTNGATLNGTVSSNGLSTAVSFDYGTTTSYGSNVTATPSPLAAGAANTAVSATLSGLNCGTTYHYRVKGVNSAGTSDGSDNTFATSACFVCSPPSNIPAGVTVSCQCDNFGRSALNPSTIFGANWNVSTSDNTGVLPSIVNPSYLRLTNNTAANAKAATVPGIFPAAGNYISVEFKQYAYNGSGADGIAVTLSDYAVPAVPGAFGGSLGYAQKSNPGSDCTTAGGCPGFAGGWVGVALDEYGNYSAATEGRVLGPGATAQSVGVRGPGSGQNGYRWMGGALGVGNISNNGSTTPAPGYMYQVIVDARNSATNQILVYVNRDSTAKDGTSYTNLFGGAGGFNAYTEANYALSQGWISSLIPNNWQISFTGSTGGANNIHEIGGLRICAQTMVPPSGGTAGSFNAIDEAYGTPPGVAVQNYLTGHIYTKLEGTPFKLDVAALNNNQIVTTYAAGGSKTVTVKLVDNSDSLANPSLDCTLSCSAACTSKPAVTGGSQTLTFASGATDKGQKQSPSFTINSAYQKLVAIISDGATTACSTDAFAVRPLSITSVVSSNATNSSTTGTPIFKAGSDNFSLTATTSGIAGNASGYTGVMKINNKVSSSTAANAGTVAGTFPAATSATAQSTATGTTFNYSEVGGFTLPGYAVTDISSRRGVYDGVATVDECTTAAQCDALKAATWTGVDSISTKGDCVSDSYSNAKDATGKYGCNFGLITTTAVIGRFIPDHFDTVVKYDTVSKAFMPCPAGLTCPISRDPYGNGFVYSGQPFAIQVTAQNASNATTKNYAGTFAKPVTLTTWDAVGGSTTSCATCLTNGAVASSAFIAGVASSAIPLSSASPTFTFATIQTAPTDIYIRATESAGGDGITSLLATPASSPEGGVKVVSGRINVTNAYGSELLPLVINATLQYWGGPSAGYVTSTTDTVNTLNASNISRISCQGKLLTGASCNSLGSISSVTLLSTGKYSIKLSAPGSGNIGSEDLIVNAGTWPAWLPSITGRATFGIYGGSNGSSEFIYMKESY